MSQGFSHLLVTKILYTDSAIGRWELWLLLSVLCEVQKFEIDSRCTESNAVFDLYNVDAKDLYRLSVSLRNFDTSKYKSIIIKSRLSQLRKRLTYIRQLWFKCCLWNLMHGRLSYIKSVNARKELTKLLFWAARLTVKKLWRLVPRCWLRMLTITDTILENWYSFTTSALHIGLNVSVGCKGASRY